MFIAALSTIAKVWKEPKCLSMDEWIKKMWYIYTMEYYSAIALLGIYPRDTDVLFRRDTRTPMFIAALSTIAKVWKEPKCPSMDEWIKKMWYIYTMELLLDNQKE